jgi:hypothetical protein
VTLAQVGRVAGQSKHTWLAGLDALIFLNCAFLSAEGMQTWPRPAAVIMPSWRILPDMGADMTSCGVVVGVVVLVVLVVEREVG